MRASGAEAALRGNTLTVDALVAAMEELQHDISPGNTPGGYLPCSANPPRCDSSMKERTGASARVMSPLICRQVVAGL